MVEYMEINNCDIIYNIEELLRGEDIIEYI